MLAVDFSRWCLRVLVLRLMLLVAVGGTHRIRVEVPTLPYLLPVHLTDSSDYTCLSL